MEFDELSALVTFAELKNFSRAGKRLHLSTPAVFGRIRRLELELGGPFYVRVGRRLDFTDRGRLLVEHARRILSTRDCALLALSAEPAPDRNRLRIGSGP